MGDPFFTSHWNAPFYPVQRIPSARGIPVHDVRTAASPRVVAVQPTRGIRSAEPSKVVTIPVHFVDTDRRGSQSESAVRIQKVFRGFMVRKSVKKISDVRREVDEIEKRISKKEIVDLMRRNSRERLGVSETLMSLLLRLDSVRGVDPGVRDCRKTVIRKVIALQETLDAIVAVDESSAAETVGEEAVEVEAAMEVPVDDEKPSDPSPVTHIEHRSPDLLGDEPESADEIVVPQIQTEPSTEKSPVTSHESERNEAEGERMEAIEPTESQTDSSANPESPVEGNQEKERRMEEEEEEEEEEAGREGKEKSKEMLERMMEENERMMEMMAELFERNELQTRLLSSLSQRVEQLEKAFVCDKLRRKKKRNAAATKAEAPEKSPEGKKSVRG